MFSLTNILQFLCLIPILGGAIFSILTVLTIQHFLKNSEPNIIYNFTPPLTVLKPVRGLEKNLKRNLRTIATQDYPNYQIIYSVQDPEDPALPILKEIQEEFGSDLISLVVSTLEAGANGKVNNLLGAIKEARHDIIIISDSDTNLQPNYLKKIVAPLDNPEVGCVCTLFKVIRGNHWFEKMELLTINADFIPSVIFAEVTGASNACLGPSIAIRQSTLKKIGGLESLADYLVEDYEIGRRVWTSGEKMVLLPYIIDVVVDLKNSRDWWNHQVYWDQNTYLAQPLPFIATILIRSIPFALLLALIRGDIIGLYSFIGSITIRLITAAITSWKMEDMEGIKSLYLLPFRDLLGLVFWVLSFTQRTVVWRGVEFKLASHGKMVIRHH
ncbi:MAG: bacteriohopanetetrol glucosamine biosynthesis glycosyltransferase HpnI [cyanobacterium endosymbiont of Rhopalodia musculus]|uniref:bacteriohopanetetrol glucosamine biosynthesis glycosyltransferase HpnI n=1 Tax=cyanobacterium endosymbiont of Epithemia clementina EcSB TaxID=3034674 RepID=UPI0024815147|nr:bacteriohopanetetrol glucosamine biosynthesis glycosyltransferase HpnI [cyanobacterium endosymbiont of Epithemia clementina EcSB]WGT68394.1 bacteriohopanetetrol glucosamine biosynthesis glycosyltransferase HpnI [cyanobacterium endosymbiont of Epithemia clementina EcSB]